MSKFNVGGIVKATYIPSYGEGKVFKLDKNNAFVHVNFSGQGQGTTSNIWHVDNLTLVRKAVSYKTGDKVRVLRDTKSLHGNDVPAGIYSVADPFSSIYEQTGYIYLMVDNNGKFVSLSDIELYDQDKSVLPEGTLVKITSPSSNHFGQIGSVINTYKSNDLNYAFGYRVRFDNDDIRQYLPSAVTVVTKPDTPKFKVGDKVSVPKDTKSLWNSTIPAGIYSLKSYGNNSPYNFERNYVLLDGRSGNQTWNDRFASINDVELYVEPKAEVKSEPTNYIVVKQGDKVLKKFEENTHNMNYRNDGGLLVWQKDERGHNSKIVGSYTQYGYTSATIESE